MLQFRFIHNINISLAIRFVHSKYLYSSAPPQPQEYPANPQESPIGLFLEKAQSLESIKTAQVRVPSVLSLASFQSISSLNFHVLIENQKKKGGFVIVQEKKNCFSSKAAIICPKLIHTYRTSLASVNIFSFCLAIFDGLFKVLLAQVGDFWELYKSF